MAQRGDFASVAAEPHNPMWRNCVKREKEIYSRGDDIRTEFARDYNRILHSTAYRRLKHKTQVFFATKNDHICTRIEHVSHVTSVSQTISAFLGLNTELATAIALGHDIGHAPFGHQGETILGEVAKKELDENFWHEKNSLWFVDQIETLEDPEREERNLDLTYAVRDGIICHCGEVSDKSIIPREEAVDLTSISMPGQYPPYTWEGCVVKIADKISYLGRDIEDALALRLLRTSDLRELKKIIRQSRIEGTQTAELREINNTILIHGFIVDLCKSSALKEGIRLSEDYYQLMKLIRDFNYTYIYNHRRLDSFKNYARLLMKTIFDFLVTIYRPNQMLSSLDYQKKFCPVLADTFADWLIKYSDLDPDDRARRRFSNKIVYQVGDQKSYIRAAIDFISGMTDRFAIKVFEELINF